MGCGRTSRRFVWGMSWLRSKISNAGQTCLRCARAPSPTKPRLSAAWREPLRNFRCGRRLRPPAQPARVARAGRFPRETGATLIVAPRAGRPGVDGGLGKIGLRTAGGLERTRLRATGGMVGFASAGVEDQRFKDNQVGSILIILTPPPPPTLPPGSKATDPGLCSTTDDRTTIACSPAATAGAPTLGGNAPPATASAAPAIDEAIGPLCAGALPLSSDEALTEGPGSSSLGLGINRLYLTLLTVLVLTRLVMRLSPMMPPMILA